VAVTCITANLQHRDSALRAVLAHEPDILFAQEAPADWTGRPDGYRVFEYRDTKGAPAYRCRSLVAVRCDSGLQRLHPTRLVPNSKYHRSYVAVTTVELPDIGTTTLVSVHASPTRIADSSPYLKDWAQARPIPRSPSGGELWDSDYVLATIKALTSRDKGQIIVAGDLNEARKGTSYSPEWADRWFKRAQRFGLVNVTDARWGTELPTHGKAQLDHVLASESMESRISAVAVLYDVANDSDHRPILFTIG
jgi:endonuclease/exonuclease/phosphatase family metal-dependent hydrolase